MTVRFPESGTWADLLSGYRGSWQFDIRDNKLDLQVGSNWGHIFFK